VLLNFSRGKPLNPILLYYSCLSTQLVASYAAPLLLYFVDSCSVEIDHVVGISTKER